MAFETILEFDKNNRYKVKFSERGIDTSTVCDIKIDEGIACLSQEDRETFSFRTREFYECEGEHDLLDEDGFPMGVIDWYVEYYIDRLWNIRLENGELVLKNTKHYEKINFTRGNIPEEVDEEYFDGQDFEDDLDKDAEYDIFITYEKLPNDSASSITLNCHNIDSGSNYGTGIGVPNVELNDADIEKLAEWYVKHYGNGSVAVEDVKNHGYDSEIKEIIEEAILDNATVYDESASKYYIAVERTYYVNYSAKVNCSFELNGMTFNINYDKIKCNFILGTNDRPKPKFILNSALEDYSKVLELLEKDELENQFTYKDKEELEWLKTRVNAPYYSVTSVPVEIDWDLCKRYAKEEGVADEYLTEANLNRALELALQDTINRYTYSMHLVNCSFYTKDGLIHGETKLTEYNDTIKKDIETIGKLTIDKDDLGIWRLYVSGEMQDDLEKAKEYKQLIRKIGLEIERFTFTKKQIDDTFRININKKISNILPTVMEGFLTIVGTDKNREWLNKKLELAEELSQSTEVYLKTKREVVNLLEDEIKNKFKNGTSQIEYLLGSEKRMDSFEGVIGFVMEILTDLQVGKSSFSLLHKAEVMFEDKLKSVKNRYEVSLREVRSKLERLLSKYSESERENIPYSVLLDERRDEKMVQEIEEILAITKQPKLTTAEEQMVSAWNKYIGLKMEGKE